MTRAAALAILVLVARAHADATVRAPADVRILVGVLSEQYEMKCDGERVSWGDPHFEIGFVRLVGGKDAWRQWLGKVVIASGQASPGAVRRGGWSCLPQQMRSDFVVAKDGMRYLDERRGRLATLGAFAVASLAPVAPFLELDAAQPGRVHVRALPVEPARLIARYEGCFGKPGSRSLDVRAEAGSVFVQPVEVVDGESRYVLHSFRLEVDSRDTVFDLTLPTNLRCRKP